MTRHIGKILSEIYGIPAMQDRQWEETKDYYAHTVRNCELPHISHLGEYLKAVSNPDYSVFISVREDAVTGLTEEIKQYLKEFGLKTDLSDKHRYSYYAVIVPGQPVIEAASREALTATAVFVTAVLSTK